MFLVALTGAISWGGCGQMIIGRGIVVIVSGNLTGIDFHQKVLK